MAISFVNSATWTSGTTNDDFTLTLPEDSLSGDLLIACVVFEASSLLTVTPPSGWTLVRSTHANGSLDGQLSIMKRTVQVGDPATWAGTLSSNTGRKTSVVAAYSGADPVSGQFIAEGGSTDTNGGSSIVTATVNNTDANAWRVTVAFAVEDGTGPDWDSSAANAEVIERQDIPVGSFDRLLFADSNGAIATGNTSRTCTYDASYTVAASWIGLIKPFSNVTGTLGMTAPRPSVTLSGGAKVSGTAGLTAPKLAGAFDVTLEVSGTLGMAAPKAQAALGATVHEGLGLLAPSADMSLSGVIEVAGDLGLMAPIPTTVVGGEALISGNRVITVRADSRIVIP